MASETLRENATIATDATELRKALQECGAQVLESRIWRGRQSYEARAIIAYTADLGAVHRLRFEVDVDSYDFQSSAVVSRWNGSEWKHLGSTPYPQMQTVIEGVGYYDDHREGPAKRLRAIIRDVLALLETAQAVLS